MPKYISLNIYSNEDGDSVVHEATKLERVADESENIHDSPTANQSPISLERMYIAVANKVSGRLIIKANGNTLFDGIVSQSKKQQVVELAYTEQKSIKLEFSFLCFVSFESKDPEIREVEGLPKIFKVVKLVSLLILTN